MKKEVKEKIELALDKIQNINTKELVRWRKFYNIASNKQKDIEVRISKETAKYCSYITKLIRDRLREYYPHVHCNSYFDHRGGKLEHKFCIEVEIIKKKTNDSGVKSAFTLKFSFFGKRVEEFEEFCNDIKSMMQGLN